MIFDHLMRVSLWMHCLNKLINSEQLTVNSTSVKTFALVLHYSLVTQQRL